MAVGFVAPIGNVVSKGDTVWQDPATGYVYIEPAPGRLKAIVIEPPSSCSNEVAVRFDKQGESNEPT